MAMTSGWRLFTSSLKVRGSPTLLIKHETVLQNNGKVSRLRVCVTDLTYLWTEILERKELVRKACDTSIDPTEQLDILLEYLTRGLNFGPGTSLSLKSEKGRSHLVLHLRSPLPAPLKPLEWDFDLRHASESEFTKEFIIPLLGSLFDSHIALSDLELIINQKDKAIERIGTELKTHNQEMTSLFDRRFYGEGVAEKHRKGILMNKIPGFRPFDADKWQAERSDQVLPSVKDLNKHIFEHGLLSKAVSDSISQEAWWEDLGSGVEVEEPSQISQPSLVHRESTSAFESSQALGNGTQSINNRRQGARSSSPPDTRPKSRTDDVAEDSDATASTMSDVESPPKKPFARGIGKIGSRTQVDEAESVNKPLSPEPDLRSGSRSTDIEANEGRPRGGIGKIGGSRASRTTEAGSTARLSQSDRIPIRPTSTYAEEDHQLGEGSKNGNSSVETAEQRANRQRAALKHDLEEKRKAPGKKRRKF